MVLQAFTRTAARLAVLPAFPSTGTRNALLFPAPFAGHRRNNVAGHRRNSLHNSPSTKSMEELDSSNTKRDKHALQGRPGGLPDFVHGWGPEMFQKVGALLVVRPDGVISCCFFCFFFKKKRLIAYFLKATIALSHATPRRTQISIKSTW